MKRRQLLKQLAVATTAAVLLPSCITDRKKLSVALNSLAVTGEDEELLGHIASTIIPATDTPGAKEVEAHLFTFIMVDDCEKPEAKEKFLKGLRAFDATVKDLTGKTFTNCSPEERLEALKKLEASNDALDDNVRTFYNLTRGYIIYGYTTSQHFLTNVKPYQLIPGPDFKGGVPVTSNQTVS